MSASPALPPGILSHVSIGIKNFARSGFSDAVLGALQIVSQHYALFWDESAAAPPECGTGRRGLVLQAMLRVLKRIG